MLICDPDPEDLRQEKAVVESLGFPVATANHQGLRGAARRWRPRLVAVATRGAEEVGLLGELRQDSVLRRTALLALASNGLVGEMQVREQGANGVVRKPLSPHRFRWEIHRLLSVPFRRGVSWPVRLYRGDGPLPALATTIDVSLGGMLLEVGVHLDNGERLGAARIGAPDGEELDVVVVRRAAERGSNFYGVRFLARPGLVEGWIAESQQSGSGSKAMERAS